ncbi:glycerate kinase, partial [Mycobacterium tuberculosis]|nr:glycerate kinase [Mycobacterium tuberculosis]
MKIVIAPDSYKESLSASEVTQAIEKGFREIFPDAQYVSLPVADGGEGAVPHLLSQPRPLRPCVLWPPPAASTASPCRTAFDESR